MNTELSSEARRLIDAARGFDNATAEDRVRVQARLLTQLAAGAGLGAVAGSARAAGAKGWVAQTFSRALPTRVLLKGALGAGVAAAVAVGVALSWPTAKTQLPAPKAAAPASASPTLQSAAPAAPEATTPEAPTASGDQPATTMPPATLPPATMPRPSPAATPRPTKAAMREAAPGHLDEELRLVSAARAALKQGEAGAALERLGEYQQRFPEGALTVEARALRVDALCAAGERDASAEAAEAFLKHWPESPLAARVRAACQ